MDLKVYMFWAYELSNDLYRTESKRNPELTKLMS